MDKPHLTAEQRALASRLHAKGLNFREVGEQIDCSLQTAWNAIMKRPTRVERPFSWSPGPGADPAGTRGDQPCLASSEHGLERSEREWRALGLSSRAGPRTGLSAFPSTEVEKAFVTGARRSGLGVADEVVVTWKSRDGCVWSIQTIR